MKLSTPNHPARFSISAASVLLLACSARAEQFSIPDIDQQSASVITGIDWYIDATASMQGFVRADRITTFAYFEKILESRLNSLCPPSEAPLTFNRFGLTTNHFENLKNSWRPAFFAPAPGFEDTDLSIVARNMRPGHITILITDLFQSDSHVESFRSALLKQGLGKAFQFAVVAFRAEFDGIIYDIPPARAKQRYRGNRPVYALLMGPADRLKTLLDSLLEQPADLGTNLFAAMFSNRVGSPVTSLHDLNQQASKGGYFLAQGLDSDQQLILGGPKNFTRELRLSRSAPQPRIDFTMDFDIEPYEAVPAPESFGLVRKTWICSKEMPGFLDRLLSNSSSNNKSNNGCSVVPPESDIVYDDSSAVVSRIAPHTLCLKVALDFGKRNDAVKGVRAKSSRTYIVQVTVSSRSGASQLPDWVSTFSENGRHAFEPSKTPELDDFLSSIQTSVTQGAPVVLLNSYLFINSK